MWSGDYSLSGYESTMRRDISNICHDNGVLTEMTTCATPNPFILNVVDDLSPRLLSHPSLGKKRLIKGYADAVCRRELSVYLFVLIYKVWQKVSPKVFLSFS